MAKSNNSDAKSAASEPLWRFASVALITSCVGILAAFAVIWWSLLAQAGQQQADERISARHATYLGVVNNRIQALQDQLTAMAQSDLAVSAAITTDPAVHAANETSLAQFLTHGRRLSVFARGAADVDLSAAVPITFAALDLIKKAESQPFVGPEASQSNAELIYAAAPITNQGRIVGVLFAAIDAKYFGDAMAQALPEAPQGLVSLQQSFLGGDPRVLVQVGSGGLPEAEISTNARVSHWQVVYWPNQQVASAGAGLTTLAAPLALALLVTLAGIYLAFSRLGRQLGGDLTQLSTHASNLVRGRSSQLQKYALGGVQSIANELSQLKAKPADDGPPLAAVPKAPQKKAKQQTKKAERAPDAGTSADLLDGSDDVPVAEEFLEVETPKALPKDENYGIEVDENVGPVDMGLNLDPGIFRAYDIRGITTTNLTEDVVYWIGRAFAAEALQESQQQVAIGRDGRLSSEPLRDALERGLTEGGVDVLDVGMVPTPVLYYATFELNTGTGIMITGSHNPPEYNGLKMMIDGVTLAEDRIQRLYRRLKDNDLSEGSGSTQQAPLLDAYIDRITSDVVVAQPLKLVVDCGNGVAGVAAPRLLQELGCEVVPLYCDVDGTFPNHHPDPAEPHTLQDLITVVEAEKADLGLAFDGDGDRVGVVTNTGEIIWPDKLLMLFSQDIVGRNPGADIIYDVKCSRHLNALISEYGGRPIMWKTGHSHIKAKIKETGALLAGEFSGHICFGERWYGFDDALYSAARLVEIIGSESQNADELFAQFPVTFTTPELKINTTEEAKFEIMDQLAATADFGDGTVTTIDGLRVDYADGWGLIRPSNTSPVLSLRFEADGQSALDRIQRLFEEQLATIDPGLKFR